MQITDTTIVSIPLSQLVCNEGQIDGVPANPRILRDEKYRALVESLRNDNLTGINPLKVYWHSTDGANKMYVVLGGNMRLRALQDLGASECPCIEIPQDTPTEVLRKIVVLDNSTFGEWDWDMLANEWDDAELKDWGIDVPTEKEKDNEEILYQEPIQLEPGMEYVLIVCKDADEFEEARKYFGLGFVAEVEGGKKNVKPTRQRVIKFSDYVNSHTEQGQTVQK